MTQTIGINTPITLQRVVPETNTRRQYMVRVEGDLFGAPVVVCRWGRIGRAGQMRTHACPDIDAARALAADVLARRRQRGYDSGDETGRQPPKVRARRPSGGQTRRRAATAKAQAAAAQLPLFDTDTLCAAWLNRWPRRTPFVAQATVAQAPQTDPDCSFAPRSRLCPRRNAWQRL